MVTIARRRIDEARAERNSLVHNKGYGEVVYDGVRIPVVTTARPANDGVSAHNPKNSGGVRMVIISLPRLRCLETDDD